MSTKAPVGTSLKTNARRDMVDFRVSLQQLPCVVPTHVNTTFNSR